MKQCLFLCLLVPIVSSGQQSFLSGSAGVDLSKELEPGVSVRIYGGIKLNDYIWVGAGTGITKLARIKNAYVPLSASFNIGAKTRKKVFPIVVLEPGYGFYSHTETDNRGANETKGGFTFFGGLGLGFSERKTRIHLAGGYSVYTFNTEGKTLRYECLVARLGLTLFR